ncbi:MAG TPA: GTPase domain-containing protein [Solirubrobacterales bacterium]|nr:GTPase domain-containing protein [Solirubrobacterales bacterium]
MIVQLRGSTGAGKSTLVHRLIEEHGGEVVDVHEFDRGAEVERMKLWRCEGGLHVIGNYTRRDGESVSRGRGADAMNGAVADDMFAHYTGLGLPHLLWESALDSMVMPGEPRLSMTRELGVVWATLDTPADVCLERVLRRREERGVTEKDPPRADSIAAMVEAVRRRATEARSLGIHSVTLRWDDDPHARLHDLLSSGGWLRDRLRASGGPCRRCVAR